MTGVIERQGIAFCLTTRNRSILFADATNEQRRLSMGLAEELKPKLDNNHHYAFITDADDLLAAWRHRRENTFKRSFDISRVPEAYRLSAPPNENAPLMPCHVTLRRKLSQVTQTIKPGPEYSSPSTATATAR
jgi:hypothetical protein